VGERVSRRRGAERVNAEPIHFGVDARFWVETRLDTGSPF
jgi:hypothetical protein